jgi:hypothetical protein
MSRFLEEHLQRLNREIRAYPTPIARCDEQLGALLEERAKVISQLNNAGSCSAAAAWTNDGGLHGA